MKLKQNKSNGKHNSQKEHKAMFNDIRSKKVVLIAHCLINQNATSDGTAVYPAVFNDLITLLMQNNIGIVQMPCPELCCLGLDRGNPSGADSPVLVENTRIRSAMQQKEPNARLQKLIDYVMLQIYEYQKHGFKIMAIIGANRSPNCGVDTTSENNQEISGMGLFMSGIAKQLKEKAIEIPFIGIKASDGLEKINKLLKSAD